MASSSNLQVIQTVYYTILLIFWLIICPIAFRYCYEIWKLRSSPFWKKRYPKLTIAVVFSVAYWVGIGRPIADLSDIFPSIHNKVPIPISNSPLSQLCLVLMYIRIWFLYYNYNNGLQLISKQWETVLLSQNTNEKTTTQSTKTYWTFDKKWNYLSDKYLIIYYIAITYVIITDIILLLAALKDQYLEYLFYTSFVGLSLIPIVFVSVKVRKCRDELFLHSEFKLLAILGVITLFSYLLCRFIVNDIALQKLLRHVMISIEGAIAMFINTKYVINKSEKRKSEERVVHHIRGNYSESGSVLSLPAVLRDDDAFELFALQLVKEFSIENLLFLYECMKFKHNCVDNGWINMDEIGVVVEFSEKIGSIPMSSINYIYIVDRYVRNNAEYPVNLSYNARIEMINAVNNVMDIINKETILKYVICIDKGINEIMRLLSSDSFARFTNSNTFKNLYS
eukprot:497475_1